MLSSSAYDLPPEDEAERLAEEQRIADELELAKLAAELWRAGDLRWKLDDHQVEIYDLFYEWWQRKQTPEYAAEMVLYDDALDDVWVELIARRFGKTAGWIIRLFEIALQRPGSLLTYATALQVSITEIIVPLAKKLWADAPDDVRPEYHGSQKGLHEGIYFKNGSVIKLVGIDKHPDALRGQYSDGIVISEARDVRKLLSTIRSVLLPQFQRRPWAFLAIETSAPDSNEHDVMRAMIPDAKRRRAYVERDLDANTAIDPIEKAKAIRQAGGRGAVECEREYYNNITRDANVVVVPEFNEKVHVRPHAVPEFAHAYVAIDPGMRDLCAILWALWDFENAILYVQADWAKRYARIAEIAEILKEKERKLWGTDHALERRRPSPNMHPALLLQHKAEQLPEGLHYWSPDRQRIEQNPYRRVSDIEPRLINELKLEHGLSIANADKSTGARRELARQESAIHGVRSAFHTGQIVIDPACETLILHLNAARWNEQRTDYERSDTLGHCDLLDALVYLWRAVNRKANPLPPLAHGKDRDNTFIREEHERRQQQRSDRVSLAEAIPLGGSRWRPNGGKRWGR